MYIAENKLSDAELVILSKKIERCIKKVSGIDVKIDVVFDFNQRLLHLISEEKEKIGYIYNIFRFAMVDKGLVFTAHCYQVNRPVNFYVSSSTINADGEIFVSGVSCLDKGHTIKNVKPSEMIRIGTLVN